MHRLERRIYQIDKFNLAKVIPGGLRLQTFGYFLVVLLAMLLLSRLPLVQLIPKTLGGGQPLVGSFLLALASAAIAQQVSPDGRAPHRFLASWIRSRLQARRVLGDERMPAQGSGSVEGEVTFQPDDDWPELFDGDLEGPGVVHFADPVILTDHRDGHRHISIGDASDPGAVHSVALREGEHVRLRP